MPDLSNTVRWLEFQPDLLGNLDAAKPFYFRLHGSMSKTQLLALEDALEARGAVPDLPKEPTEEQKAAHTEAVRVEVVKKYAGALEPYVKLGEEPLSFDGQPVKTLADYFDVVTKHLAGLELLFEPYRALVSANTLGVRGHFFSARLSGGSTSTASRRSGKGSGSTAVR